ncbi:ATP-dependent zinc metalloprotease FtsH [Rhodobacteraceae bacterium N5(2021)]|uniref:ATP-dependent zinc metalloprotease FtsH n=1 Tax=Gymnodinialimonas phycosphaerae TaxID=2841589 RepID=A0A975YEJ1_9RHOB|nr:ATP-dependent zinc metalloprotease FtsH [Gymnodinialimonas phycosphaerae]MBY4893635.1 ATP-dependent zinc metalloprotease FtsH [Gymnodinialimonas phycosphaerae]
MDKQKRFNWGFWLFAAVLWLALQIWLGYRSVLPLQYSEFLTHLESGNITEVTVTETLIEGRFATPVDEADYFVTNRVDPDFAEDLAQYDLVFTGASDQTWLTTLISWIMPVLLFFGLWMVLIRRMSGGQGFGSLVNIGKSKAKVYLETQTGVTFDNVAGVDEAKAELQEIVSFLQDREKYGRLGAHIPKGILLVGPPGTGKTLLARAVAGEAGVPFFSISGSEFVEMFVGVGAARVRDLFEQARQAAPCIIFIDELDALGRARSAVSGYGGGDEKEQTLNQLLSELDGFDPRVGIVLLAATNRPEVLDAALLRAGRFDRQIVVDRPERKGRAAILKVHMKGVSVADDVDLDQVAAITTGFTGADLANLVNEAAIVATRRDGDKVTMADLTAAVERIVAGTERKSRVLGTSERERVAHHEMGHALAAAHVAHADPVHKVSIIPRSIGALGYTMQRPTEDRFLITFSELKDRMVVLMAGRAAEDLIFHEVSTGASDDLAKVTDIARECVTRFGMTADVGQAVLERQLGQYLDQHAFVTQGKDYSEATAREVDLAVRKLIAAAYDDAKAILQAHLSDLKDGASLLLEKETLTPDDFAPIARASRGRSVQTAG